MVLTKYCSFALACMREGYSVVSTKYWSFTLACM